MGKLQYRQPKRLMLEPGESVLIAFNNSLFWPPMVIHYEDGGVQDRLDKKLAAARTPSMLQELLDARKKET